VTFTKSCRQIIDLNDFLDDDNLDYNDYDDFFNLPWLVRSSCNMLVCQFHLSAAVA